MSIPKPNLNPAFNIVRVSHVDFAVTDLGYSREFYADILGYHLEEETADALYLRGMEELNHHSLVLTKADRPSVNRIGFKVRTEEDLDKAAAYFAAEESQVEWVEKYAQGRTLHVHDRYGVPLEFYYSMERGSDILQKYRLYHGAKVQRIDHVNLFHHDVNGATKYYSDAMGFQVTEVTVTDKTDPDSDIWAAWMHRKGGVHDVAFTNGTGPRLHHIGIWIPTATDIIDFCDQLASSGHEYAFERGPGRHGISNAFFLYIRDRDGHRVELFASDYLTVDPDHPVRAWDLLDPKRQTLWGHAAPRTWFELGSEFVGLETQPALLNAKPIIAPE